MYLPWFGLAFLVYLVRFFGLPHPHHAFVVPYGSRFGSYLWLRPRLPGFLPPRFLPAAPRWFCTHAAVGSLHAPPRLLPQPHCPVALCRFSTLPFVRPTHTQRAGPLHYAGSYLVGWLHTTLLALYGLLMVIGYIHTHVRLRCHIGLTHACLPRDTRMRTAHITACRTTLPYFGWFTCIAVGWFLYGCLDCHCLCPHSGLLPMDYCPALRTLYIHTLCPYPYGSGSYALDTPHPLHNAPHSCHLVRTL